MSHGLISIIIHAVHVSLVFSSRRWAPEIVSFVMGREEQSVVELMSKITPDDLAINFLPYHFYYVGGSAGAVLFIAVVSFLTGAKVVPNLAMTGAIGLR